MLSPNRVQRPPPLLIGGSGGTRSAALAARFADEYNTPFPALEEIAQRVDQACNRAGREPIPFSIMAGLLVGADSGEVRERAERLASVRGGDADSLLSEPPTGWIVGTLEQAAEQLTAIQDLGVSRVMCQHLLHDDLDVVRLLGRELAPAVR